MKNTLNAKSLTIMRLRNNDQPQIYIPICNKFYNISSYKKRLKILKR